MFRAELLAFWKRVAAVLARGSEADGLVSGEFDGDLAPGQAVAGVNHRPDLGCARRAGFGDHRQRDAVDWLGFNLGEAANGYQNGTVGGVETHGVGKGNLPGGFPGTCPFVDCGGERDAKFTGSALAVSEQVQITPGSFRCFRSAVDNEALVKVPVMMVGLAGFEPTASTPPV